MAVRMVSTDFRRYIPNVPAKDANFGSSSARPTVFAIYRLGPNALPVCETEEILGDSLHSHRLDLNHSKDRKAPQH
jgi:hypothetical protein